MYFLVDCDNDDASTVINHRICNDSEERKDTRPGSPSKSSKTQTESNLNILANKKKDPNRRFKKVRNWLDTSYVQQTKKTTQVNRVPYRMLEIESPEKIQWLHSIERRVKVMLMNTEPSIKGEPLDFVSGHCSQGTTNFFKFTELYWDRSKSSEINEMVPYCPSCMAMGKKSVVFLFLNMKMLVVDSSGHYIPVILYKGFAEQFFGCSTENFVNDSSLRQRKIQVLEKLMDLKDGCLVQYLDLCIAIFDNIAHLVSGQLA